MDTPGLQPNNIVKIFEAVSYHFTNRHFEIRELETYRLWTISVENIDLESQLLSRSKENPKQKYKGTFKTYPISTIDERFCGFVAVLSDIELI